MDPLINFNTIENVSLTKENMDDVLMETSSQIKCSWVR